VFPRRSSFEKESRTRLRAAPGFDKSMGVMSWGKLLRGALALLCGLAWSGCSVSGPGASEEEKEPQFLIGRNRVNAMDYGGAIEAFNQALEVNPHSAAAHFELGWLYAEKDSNPAAAIHHYQQYLRWRPSANNAETIRDHIARLKQELARDVLPMPPASDVQKQIEDLAEENRQLRAELEKLRGVAVRAFPTNAAPVRSVNSRSNAIPSVNLAGRNPPVSPARVATPPRTHKILAGDTPTSVARRYNVKVEALLAANPGLDPRRMRIGQSLNIPGS
jgi:tetratricopeptide (TPR) repeat protein